MCRTIHVTIAGANQHTAGEEQVARLRFADIERAAFVEALGKHFGEASGMCWTTRMQHGKSAGICDSTYCRALGPPVETPIAMTRVGGSVGRAPFVGGGGSSGTVAGGKFAAGGAFGHFDLFNQGVSNLFEMARGRIGRLGDEINGAESERFSMSSTRPLWNAC